VGAEVVEMSVKYLVVLGIVSGSVIAAVATSLVVLRGDALRELYFTLEDAVSIAWETAGLELRIREWWWGVRHQELINPLPSECRGEEERR